MEIINTIGRRKTSIARVYVKPGNGLIIVNERELNDYFPSEILRTTVKQALTIVKADGQYDVTVNVEGGGNKGRPDSIPSLHDLYILIAFGVYSTGNSEKT
jgi:small subunit ribosomal protein S9